MKTLIIEDDYITSRVMQEITSSFGRSDIAENGSTALVLFKEALLNKMNYDVLFLDIMMPEMDGQEVLDKIREMEKSHGIMGLDCVKIVMSTALDDFGNIKTSFRHQCDAYIVKPIDKDKIVQALINLQILE